MNLLNLAAAQSTARPFSTTKKGLARNERTINVNFRLVCITQGITRESRERERETKRGRERVCACESERIEEGRREEKGYIHKIR